MFDDKDNDLEEQVEPIAEQAAEQAAEQVAEQEVADADSAPASQFTIPDNSNGFALAEKAAWYLHEIKAENVLIMDLRGFSDVCDYFVVATGNSATQVQALAKNVQDGLFNAGAKPKGLEGQNKGTWILVDYFDVIVHVFQKESREYFRLEKLWGDAPMLEIEPEWFGDQEVQDRHPDLNFILAVRPEGVDGEI